MGNQFLGFPVPRAKIAQMITGTAAPSAHHTQHENGGSDEMDVTGLTGAGGGGVALGGFMSYGSTFESLSGYDTTPTGSGATTIDLLGVTLYTGATANSNAYCDKSISQTYPICTFSKDRALIANAKFYCLTSSTGDFWILSGQIGSGRHIGFKVTGGILYGTIGNGSTETTIALQTLGAGAYTLGRSLRAVFTTGVKCEFYVDGVLLGTITTNLPSGTSTTTQLVKLQVKNTGVAEEKYLVVTNYNVQIAQ